MYHAIRTSLDAHPTWAVFNVDVAYTFNALDRIPMFDTLRASPHFQGLNPFSSAPSTSMMPTYGTMVQEAGYYLLTHRCATG